jgi:hypoxanthine phosphoribosyltransferase
MMQHCLSWDWFDESCVAMARLLRERLWADPDDRPEGIIVLGRGGMVLGTRLSHLLGLPIAGAVIMSRYKNPLAGASNPAVDPPVDGVVVSPYLLRGRARVLLVDNIISEGVTLRLAQEALAGAGVAPARVTVCALLARGAHAPDGIIGSRIRDHRGPISPLPGGGGPGGWESIDPDTWFVFPWEVRT